MKVVVDTNVLISSLVFRSRNIEQIVDWCLNNHETLISDHIAIELIRITTIKSPDQLANAAEFLSHPLLQWFREDYSSLGSISLIRDANDQPILDFAVAVNADIILTGDKDFHALDIDRPRIMSPREFINEFIRDPN